MQLQPLKGENMNFTFTEQEAQIILNALCKEPYNQVVGVINNLQTQASEQMKPQPKQGFGVDVPDSDKAV